MDRRRVPGPENSVVPFPALDEVDDPPASILVAGKRLDGRRPEDMRPIFLRAGLVSQASGSAYIELGLTKIVCAIHGPRQLKKQHGFSEQGRLYCEFKFCTFACQKRRGHQRDPQEKEFSQVMVQALTPSVRLEKLPKSMVDIYVTVLENDGTSSCLAAAITCASVALADAGVELFDLVAATSLSYMDRHIFVDCCLEEENYRQRHKEKEEGDQGDLLFAQMPSLGEVTHLLHHGRVDWSLMAQGIEQCGDICAKVHAVMVRCLHDRHEN